MVFADILGRTDLEGRTIVEAWADSKSKNRVQSLLSIRGGRRRLSARAGAGYSTMATRSRCWSMGTLATKGIEAVHWTAVGDPRAPDDELLRYAREHGYVVFTHDLDFGALLALTRAHSPSVI